MTRRALSVALTFDLNIARGDIGGREDDFGAL